MSVIGLGNALMDVLIELENDVTLSDLGIRKGVMDYVDEPRMATIRDAQKHLKHSEVPGGSVCNTMRAMAHLYDKAGYIGKVGQDSTGKVYEESLKEAGVIPYLIKGDRISGSCTVLISPDGERTMQTFLGPAATIDAERDIADETLQAFDYIYIEGYLMVNEPLFRGILAKAKRLGLKIAVDLSNFSIVEDYMPMLKELIPEYVNILFSNESEAEAFTGKMPREAVEELSKIVDVSVVTCGKEGALVGSKGEIISVPAYGGKPKDTTGAGDHFAAGFLYGQTQGLSLEKSAQIGSYLAGNVIEHIGPRIPEEKWDTIKLKIREIVG